MTLFLALVLALWAALIAGVDLATRRVPNLGLAAIFAPALTALVITQHGLLGQTWQSSLLGLALALALTLPGYALGKLGAGDAKFAAVLGFLLGAQGLLVCLLLAALILGALAAATWMFRGDLKQRIPAAPALALAFGASLAGLLPAL